jgi:hypothetical protein
MSRPSPRALPVTRKTFGAPGEPSGEGDELCMLATLAPTRNAGHRTVMRSIDSALRRSNTCGDLLTAPGSAQAGTGRRTILRGREPELGALGEALQATHRGHGRVLVVDGPPGIGKSELLEEAGRMAVRLHVRSAVARRAARR